MKSGEVKGEIMRKVLIMFGGMKNIVRPTYLSKYKELFVFATTKIKASHGIPKDVGTVAIKPPKIVCNIGVQK